MVIKSPAFYARYVRCYGMRIFFAKVFQRLTGYHRTRIGRWFAPKYDEIIIKYLMEHAAADLNMREIRSAADTESTEVPKVIWMMWWQGIDQAPEIVKMCVSQIRRENKDCTIHFLDKENYKDFVKIPEKILTRAQNGELLLAHLADIIRNRLLARWGGVWMDATLFVTEPLEEALFHTHFYSVNSGVLTEEPTYGKWTNFFMASPPNSPLFLFLVEFLEKYFEQFPVAIDYFVTFYAMIIAGRIFPEVGEWMNATPENNKLCFQLRPVLNEDCAKGKVYLNSDTTIFKLSHHRHERLVRQREGRTTTYGYLLENYGMALP